jgi:hypothetical protein
MACRNIVLIAVKGPAVHSEILPPILAGHRQVTCGSSDHSRGARQFGPAPASKTATDSVTAEF